MTLGVVIPNYNGADLPPATLETALAQAARPDKVIVVDDESTDDTLEVLERYTGRMDLRVIRVRDGGDLAARNVGLRLCDTMLAAATLRSRIIGPERKPSGPRLPGMPNMLLPV